MRLEKSVSLFCQFLIFPRHLQSMHQQWKPCKGASKHTLDWASNIKKEVRAVHWSLPKTHSRLLPKYRSLWYSFLKLLTRRQTWSVSKRFRPICCKSIRFSILLAYQRMSMEHFSKPNWIAITTRVTIPKLNLIIVVCS